MSYVADFPVRVSRLCFPTNSFERNMNKSYDDINCEGEATHRLRVHVPEGIVPGCDAGRQGQGGLDTPK